MIELSLAGIAGASIGLIIAAFAYAPMLRAVQRWLRASAPAHENDAADIAFLPRAVFAADILLFAGAGYWLAASLAG